MTYYESYQKYENNNDITKAKKDFEKITKIIEKYPDRVPVHFCINKNITLKKVCKDYINNNYKLLKALVPKNMKYHELITHIRANYIALNSSKYALVCFCNDKLIPHQDTISSIWKKSRTSDYDALLVRIETENTFG